MQGSKRLVRAISAAGDNTGWWDRNGVMAPPRGAWQGVGALNYATSKIELAGVGPDLVESGDTIPWNTTIGWYDFASVSSVWDTGVEGFVSPRAMLVQFANGGSSQSTMFLNVGLQAGFSPTRFGSQCRFFNNGLKIIGGNFPTGNQALAGANGWKDGTLVVTTLPTGNSRVDTNYPLGSGGHPGLLDEVWSGSISSAVIYDYLPSNADMVAVAAAMLALLP